MQYRSLGKSGLSASVVGLGCEHLQGKDRNHIQRVVDKALDLDVNIFDVFMSEPNVRTDLGHALKGKRQKVLLQGHIGAAWLDGQYARTREPVHFRAFFEDFMTRLQTDYVDIGMLHFVDTQPDFDAVLASGIIEYAHDLKAKGIIRAVGVSSHDPIIAQKLVETGKIDVLMFSINPAYDMMPAETDLDSLFIPETFKKQAAFTVSPDRQRLYQTAEALGVGITVMKALGAMSLLDARTSPFGQALTVSQCIHYALTRPAVSSVLVGCEVPEEMEQAVAYLAASDAERDYATKLSQVPKFSVTGRCMYCNHCLPCPSHIDIAQVNKYLDLAELTGKAPESIQAHYAALDHDASDCIACGQCEGNCPFGVPVIERMERAARLFG